MSCVVSGGFGQQKRGGEIVWSLGLPRVSRRLLSANIESATPEYSILYGVTEDSHSNI